MGEPVLGVPAPPRAGPGLGGVRGCDHLALLVLVGSYTIRPVRRTGPIAVATQPRPAHPRTASVLTTENTAERRG
ncbi:hypothetical protein GCM10010400_73170 [Streptomyces aculeolatus]